MKRYHIRSDLVANLRRRVFSCSQLLSSLGLFTRLRGNTSRFIDNKERLLRKHILMLKSLDNSGYKHEMGLLINSLR